MKISLINLGQLALFLSIRAKFIRAEEWYSRFKVHERNDTDTTAEFTEGSDLVQFCPEVTDADDFNERSDYYGECHKFLRCSTARSSEANSEDKYLFVSVESCEACHSSVKNTDLCPDGTFIFSKELKRCVPPRTLTPEEHPCGVKKHSKTKCSGPKETEGLHRLGNTSFYIFHNEEGTSWVNWHDAKEMCSKVGLKLAMIDNLQTEVLIGRQLEKFIRPLGWIHNWYWMDAKFDRKLKTYVWQDTMKAINFSNFYYRPPRPKGYGDFFDNQGNYIKDPSIEYCLAQSMPLPFPKSAHENGETVPYGIHTAWWERECDSKKKGNVLCESTDPACEAAREDSIYTEITGSYYEGFWPMSNRRFVVIWTAKSFEDANALCEEQNLKMYSPDKDDTCLPQSLKNWMKTVTSWSFWTDIKYQVEDRTFIYPDGSEVPLEIKNVTVKMRKREANEGEISETCASVTWNFEEFPNNINFCNCTFNSLALSPENCGNKIGVICQPKEDSKGLCTTEYYEKAIPRGELVSAVRSSGKNKNRKVKHPKILEYYPFDGNLEWEGGLYRSAYKQQGSSGQCPNSWVRIRENDTYWGTVEDYENSSHKYDFLSPYWMKMTNGTCHLSKVNYDPDQKTLTRELTEEDCASWLGFVLCKNKPTDSKKKGLTIQGRGLSKSNKEIALEFDWEEDHFDVSEPH